MNIEDLRPEGLVANLPMPILSVLTEADALSGATDNQIEEVRLPMDDPWQPVLAHPLFSDIVLEWCVRQLANHLNPNWSAA